MSVEEEQLIASKNKRAALNALCHRSLVAVAIVLIFCVLFQAGAQLSRRSTVIQSVPYCCLDVKTNVHPVAPYKEFSWGCPRGSVYTTLHDQLWCENLDLIDEAYNSEFIQGMLYGSLPKEAFERMSLQDAYWEVHTSKIWRSACRKAKCSEALKELLHEVSKDYRATAKSKLTSHELKVTDIHPAGDTLAFVSYLRGVKNEHPVEYNAIALASDVRLWYALARRLKDKELYRDSRQSRQWVDGVLAIEPFLYDATQVLEHEGPFDLTLAGEIYREALHYNVQFFKTRLLLTPNVKMPKRARSSSSQRRSKKGRTTVKAPLKTVSATPQPVDQAELTTPAQKAVVEAVVEGKHPELQQLITESTWRDVLEDQFKEPYFLQLQRFVEAEWTEKDTTVYPPAHLIFNALESTPFNCVRVVLVGQDPYHGANQAMGLSFSVPKSEKLPSSLRNVFKEIQSDLGYSPGSHGDLSQWAHQGVLLLNTVLTVRQAEAHSHKKKGWERFTRHIISVLNQKQNHLVFFLWGAHAQHMGADVDEEKHLVLKCPHPSGLSAHRGFFGCKHFSQCNRYLESHGQDLIDWHV